MKLAKDRQAASIVVNSSSMTSKAGAGVEEALTHIPNHGVIVEMSKKTGSAEHLRLSDGSTDGGSGRDCEGSGPGDDDGGKAQQQFAVSETRQLKKLKFLVLLVLVFAAFCAVGVYFYVRNQEQDSFETQFQEDAQKVLASLSQSLQFSIGGISALSVSFVSHANATNQSWPFVTIPDFDVRSSKFLSLSNAFTIAQYNYVPLEKRHAWENYTAHHNGWVYQALDRQEANDQFADITTRNFSIFNVIYDWTEYSKENPGEEGTNRTGPYYLPVWQGVPLTLNSFGSPYNWDLMSWGTSDITSVVETHKVTLGAAYLITYGNNSVLDALNQESVDYFEQMIGPDENAEEPVSDILYPIVAESHDSHNLWDDKAKGPYDPEKYTFCGMLIITFYWREMIRNILPRGSNGIQILFANPCSPNFSYKVMGPDVEYLGVGDFADPKYEHLTIQSELVDLAEFALEDSGYTGAPLNHEYCPFRVKVSPSQTMEDDYRTNNPVVFSVTAGVIFVVFAASFFIYDAWVERRQRLVMERAQRSTAIVSAMFPESVTKRLIGSASTAETNGGSSSTFMSQKKRVKTFLSDGEDGALSNLLDEPIADLFPFTTVLVADIRGFAAWTSSRDPSQVFVLLETVFKAFDLIAKRRKVFKVETVGDRYVAVSGLPDPQERHALIMSRFAWDCLTKFSLLCNELEVRLGPETSSLALRIGMHSGPVTAGVLRVDRSRFQLFGDTCNIASQMEARGAPNRIHVSHSTANYLIASGKGHWLTRRTDSDNEGQGKGIVTYWLAPKSDATRSEHSETSLYQDLADELHPEAGDTKRARLCDWMVKLLLEHIRLVVERRAATGTVKRQPTNMVTYTRAPEQTCLDEVQDVIKLPKFDARTASRHSVPSSEIPSAAVEQLERLVSVLSATYRQNHFHNFEHACHVTQNVDKFLRRIINADVDDHNPDMDRSNVLHDYTHGITSDPLTILAIVFSALIHDSDHRGISNMQLCKEDEELARMYRSQSVAEQNSLDISWALLMDDEFVDLRACMFANQEELLRFRQVVVNVVLATDIFDKELNDLRKMRWNRAFERGEAEQHADYVDTRATIVIEHIIQASDVSHTMQHWEIYRRWNEKLFAEMTDAYKAGRMGKDPATFWYQGEIGFFDNYIIPLAMKLKECNVFGVSSDECLNYAQKNRAEWERCGQEIVATMVEKYCHRSASPETILV